MLSFLAGLSTTIGGLIAFFVRKTKFCYMCIAFGFSAGVMIFISFAELLAHAMETIGPSMAFLGFFSGMLIIYVIDILVPHSYKEESNIGKKSRIKRTALLLFVGIAIHNFPEGMAVMLASLTEIEMGILVAVAIALHNIPEGIAVAMPIYYSTKDRKKAFYYSFLSGITEPVGAVISFLFLAPFLSPIVLSLLLSAVAGIMVFISFDELLPYVYAQHGSPHQHLSILGLFLGMFIMALTMLVI